MVTKYAKITADASYLQTGYPVTAGTFGFQTAVLSVVPVSAQTYLPWYHPSRKSIRFIVARAATLTEVASGSGSLSNLTVDAAVLGY